MKNLFVAIGLVFSTALLFAQGNDIQEKNSGDSLSYLHEFCEYELFGGESLADVQSEDDKVLEIRITGEYVEDVSIILPVRYNRPLQGLVYIGKTHVGAKYYLKKLDKGLIQMDGRISFTVFEPDGVRILRNVTVKREKLTENVVRGILGNRLDEDTARDKWIVKAVVRDRYGKGVSQ